MEKVTAGKRENMINRLVGRKSFMPQIKVNRYAWVKTYYHQSLMSINSFGAKIIDIYLINLK